MRFLREYVILFLIILFVICIEIITVKITNKSLEKINTKISDLEFSIENNDIGDKMENLSEEWKNTESKLSYYMEHNELEEISSKVTNLKTNIKYNNIKDVREQLDEIKFRIEHIKNKQKFELKNIF